DRGYVRLVQGYVLLMGLTALNTSYVLPQNCGPSLPPAVDAAVRFPFTPTRMIRRRHVYHLAGYDPIDPASQHRRFVRQLAILKRTWNVVAAASVLERDHARAWWRVSARAANWQVEAVHERLAWDDIVPGDLAGPLP